MFSLMIEAICKDSVVDKIALKIYWEISDCIDSFFFIMGIEYGLNNNF